MSWSCGKRGKSIQPLPEPKVQSSLHHHLLRLSLLQRLLLVVSYLPIPILISVHASYSHLSPVPIIPSDRVALRHRLYRHPIPDPPTQNPGTRQSARRVSHQSRLHHIPKYITSPAALSWTQRSRRTHDSRTTLVVPTA